MHSYGSRYLAWQLVSLALLPAGAAATNDVTYPSLRPSPATWPCEAEAFEACQSVRHAAQAMTCPAPLPLDIDCRAAALRSRRAWRSARMSRQA